MIYKSTGRFIPEEDMGQICKKNNAILPTKEFKQCILVPCVVDLNNLVCDTFGN